MYNRLMLLLIAILVINIFIIVNTVQVCVPKNERVNCMDLVEVEDYISCLEAE